MIWRGPVPVAIKFRTVRRALLVMLVLVLIVPAGIVVGWARYYRSGAYRRHVAGELSASLGLPVAVGGVERLSRGRLRVADLRVGGRPEGPLLGAAWAALDRAADGRYEVTLEGARLAVLTRSALDELLSLPERTLRGGGAVRALRFTEADFAWELSDDLGADTATGSLTWPAGRTPADGQLTLAGGNCSVRWRGEPGGEAVLVLDGVPASVLQRAGGLPETPAAGTTASGRIVWPEFRSGAPARLSVDFAQLRLGPVAEVWGMAGVDAVLEGTLEADVTRGGKVQPALVEVRLSEGQSASMSVRVLRCLCHLLQGEMGDVPDTVASVRVTALAVAARREGDRLVLTGGLEPAGTVLRGRAGNDPAVSVALRLNRTGFSLDELRRRLADVRAGRADDDKPAKPGAGLTPAPATRPASRPVP